MSLGGPNSEIESRQVLPSPLLKFGDTFEDLHDSYTDYITNCESPKGASEHFGPSQVGKARWCFEEGRSAEWSHSPIFAPSSTDRLTSQPLPTTCLRPFPAAGPVQTHCTSPPFPASADTTKTDLQENTSAPFQRNPTCPPSLAHHRARPRSQWGTIPTPGRDFGHGGWSPTSCKPGVTTAFGPSTGATSVTYLL